MFAYNLFANVLNKSVIKKRCHEFYDGFLSESRNAGCSLPLGQ
ncbi:hypothetical protein HMPREF6485_2200 [Segatella buccae ATCC 33574]|uniref:Uncharacterized protein n=1 Tax=Segatella buccae ATCC 33574 TaxID=873513 RepID=E6K9B4_9BACT|nr:hypothetical protein HMPREF6485_2200 [Segatella buccae ATCC 33574]